MNGVLPIRAISPILVNDSGNGVFDPQLRNVINSDVAEPYTDGDVNLGEPFVDVDLNGRFNGRPNMSGGPDIFLGAWDLNHNGQHDGPDTTWSAGVPFRDLNNNGRYDAPNGNYDYGEPYRRPKRQRYLGR